MNTIEVISVSHVNVNGVNAGRVCDVLSNYRDDIASIQKELEAYEAGIVGTQGTALAAARKAESDAAERANQAEAALAHLTPELAELRASAAEMQRIISLPERQQAAEAARAKAQQLLAHADSLEAPESQPQPES